MGRRSEHERQHQRSRSEEVELILRLATYLDPAERALVEAVYDRGIAPADLARAVGQSARLVHRRLAAILARLDDPVFRYVVAHQRGWSGTQAAVADRHILQGHSQRRTARDLGVTVHRVRVVAERLRARTAEFERARRGAVR